MNSTLPPEDLGIMLDMVHSGSVDHGPRSLD